MTIKPLIYSVSIACALSICACGGTANNNNTATVTDTVQAQTSRTGKPLAQWLEETVASGTNVDTTLARTLDYIYNHDFHKFHSASDAECDTLLQEQEWVKATMEKILAQYGKDKSFDIPAQIDLIDSLVKRAEKEWGLEETGNASAMELDADLDFYTSRFKTKLAIAGLLDQAQTDEQRHVLAKQACALEAYNTAAASFCYNVTQLGYWGDSIAPVVGLNAIDDVCEAHADLLGDDLRHPYDVDDHDKAPIGAYISNINSNCGTLLKALESTEDLQGDDKAEYEKIYAMVKVQFEQMQDALKELLALRSQFVEQWPVDEARKSQWQQACESRLYNFIDEINETIESMATFIDGDSTHIEI